MKKAFLIIILFGFPTLLNAQAIKFGFFEMNDVLKAKMTLDEIKSSGVPIDSITPVPKIMDMSEADSLVYIGGTYYEYYTNTKKPLLKMPKHTSQKIVPLLSPSQSTMIQYHILIVVFL